MRRGAAAHDRYRLHRRSRLPVWLHPAWRALLAVALVGIALALHWSDRGGRRQGGGAPITFADLRYLTSSAA